MKLHRILILVSALLTVIGYVVSNPLTFGICQRVYIFNGNSGCLDGSISAIGKPLLTFSLASLFLLLGLSYLKSPVLYAWLRFAVWGIPISAILIATTPETSNSWMPLYFIGKDSVTLITAILFTLISLTIIAVKSFALRKTKV